MISVKTRVIKRYGNRKLYCTDSGRYVTLAELALSIKKGDDISVKDHQTGKDLTNNTLKSLIAVLDVDTQTLIDLIKR